MSNPTPDDWEQSYNDGALASWEDLDLPWTEEGLGEVTPCPPCYGEAKKRDRKRCEECSWELQCWVEAYYVPWLGEESNDRQQL